MSAPTCPTNSTLTNGLCVQNISIHPTCSDSSSTYDPTLNACKINSNPNSTTNNGCPDNYQILPNTGGSITIGTGSHTNTTKLIGTCVTQPVCASGFTATADKSGLSWECTIPASVCPKNTTLQKGVCVSTKSK